VCLSVWSKSKLAEDEKTSIDSLHLIKLASQLLNNDRALLGEAERQSDRHEGHLNKKEGFASEIEELAENSSFADVGVEVAFRIWSRVQVMRKERATLTFKLFFAKYRENSVEAHRSD
jgi:hypothetical protein